MKKNIEKAIVSGLIAVFVMSLVTVLLVSSVSATWCNNDYGKKAPILINNTGGSAQTYYQVELNYTYDSDMNTNFSDIRVYNESDCSLIPLWNESAISSSWNKIWFNATSIDASLWVNNTYFLYYDNPSASSVSNGFNTFLCFDDFETYNTGDLNGQGGWSGDTSYDVSTDTPNTGTKTVKITTDATSREIQKSCVLPSEFILHCAGNVSATTVRWQIFGKEDTPYAWNLYCDELGNINIMNATSQIDTGTDWTAGIWHEFELHYKSSTQDLYYDGTKIASDYTKAPSTGEIINFYTKFAATAFFDSIYIHKYAVSVPTALLGMEESQPDLPPEVTLNSPPDNTSTSQSVTFSCYASDTTNLTNVSLYGNWSGGWHCNETNTSGVNGIYTFTKTISDGVYIWNCRACDNASNCTFGTTNWTFTIDTIAPSVSWVFPTPNDEALQTETYVCLNTTFSDTHDISAVFDWNYSILRWFSFEDYNTTYVFDNSSYSTNGKMEGGTSANIIISSTKFGKAANLTEGRHIDLGKIQNFTDNFTIEAWFKNNEKGSNNIIVSSWNLSSNFSDSSNWQVADQTTISGHAMPRKAGAVYDGRYIYYQVNDPACINGNYPRFDTHCGDLSNDSCFEVFNISEVDNNVIIGFGPLYDGQYVYYPSFQGEHGRGMRVYRYNTLGNYTNSSFWDSYDVATNVDSGCEQMVGSGIDINGIIYFGEYETTSDAPGRHVVAYNSSLPFTSASSWKVFDTHDAFGIAPQHRGIIYLNGYIYTVCKSGHVFRYDTTKGFSGFTSSANWNYYNATGEDGADVGTFEGVVTDGRYIYPTPYDTKNGLVQYDTTKSFTDEGSWIGIDPSYGGSYDYAGATFDGRYVYYINTLSSDDIMVRFDTTKTFASSNFETTTVASDGGFYSGAFDGRYIYYVPQWEAGVGIANDFVKFDTAQAGTFQLLSNWQISNGGSSGLLLGTSAILNTESISYSLHARNKPNNEWHHIALVVDNKIAKLYFDKELKDNVTISEDFNIVTEDIQIGKIYLDSTNTSETVISELRFHGRVLLNDELNASFNAKEMDYLKRNFTGLSVGTYNYSAYMVDGAGNINISADRTVYIEADGDGAYNITLFTGWNIIGWTDTTTRTAHYIGTDIGSNCTYISERNKTSGNYVNHNMAGPEEEDNFAIERGWGYYAYLTAETVWNRTA